MSARSSEHHDQDSDQQPTPAEPPRTTPRGARRRIDPSGDTLHTGTPLQRQPEPMAEPPVDAPQPTKQFTGAHAAPPQQHSSTLITEPLHDSFEDEATARAKARDRAVVGSPVAVGIMQVALAILAPIVILIGIIRVIASPMFLWFEYNRPGFVPDQFGMDPEQRLTYGSYGLDYLFNFAPPAYLGDLTFANGNPLFTESEVAHMVDVKQVMLITMIAGLIAAVVCVVLMVLLYRMRKGAIARALFAGSVWFTAALVILGLVAAFGWDAFFAGFHQIFFADGTWTFATTDTLIRLYPGQFWIDAAAWIAGLTLAIMVTIMVCTAPTGRRRYRNEQSQRFMESQVMGDSKAKQSGV